MATSRTEPVFMYVICDMCWADELLFVSVGNRFVTKHVHVSINLTCKYELTYHCLPAGYTLAYIELYSSLFNVLINTTNFGGGQSHLRPHSNY